MIGVQKRVVNVESLVSTWLGWRLAIVVRFALIARGNFENSPSGTNLDVTFESCPVEVDQVGTGENGNLDIRGIIRSTHLYRVRGNVEKLARFDGRIVDRPV